MEEKNKEGQNQIPAVIRLDRQLKYTGTILKIYEDTVMANGHEAHWDFIHHDGAAAVVAVDDEGYLLMVRQYRNALDRETLEIPAGKLDAPGEPKIECAYRELEEETGYRCEHLEYLMSMNTTVAFCDEFIDIFVARNFDSFQTESGRGRGDSRRALETGGFAGTDLFRKNDRCKNNGGDSRLCQKIRKISLPLS